METWLRCWDCLNQNLEFGTRCDSTEASYETLNSGVDHICLELCGKTLSKYDHTASEQNWLSWNVIFQTSWRYRLVFDQSLMIDLEIFGQNVKDPYKQRGRLWTSEGRSDDDMIAKVWSMVSDVGVFGWWNKGDLPLSSDYQRGYIVAMIVLIGVY